MSELKTILVVDDDTDLLDIVCEILEGEGYSVARATNGYEALEYLDRSPVVPSAILLDLMMPSMDGWRFRSEQKARPRLANIPVIVLSAGGHLGPTVPEIDAAGALKKPIRIAALLQAVSELAGPAAA